MQSRYGDRLSAATWSQFERISDFARLVQTVRGTPLAPWVSDFTADTGVHRIERGLRARFRHEIGELAAWVPDRWAAAVQWFAFAPDLAAVAHVRHGRTVHDWMDEDPVIHALAGDQRADDEGLAQLMRMVNADDDRAVFDRWLEAWRTRWPREGRSSDHRVQAVYRQLRALLFTQGGAVRVRNAAETELRRAFRRHAREPAGVLAYLGLLYIQFTRLRAALVRARLLELSVAA